jgi:hypothetical protein
LTSRSPQGVANKQAVYRARQRALHRTAMHFHDEFARRKTAEAGGRTANDVEVARAMRAVARAHPRVFRRFYREQLAVETVVPLPRGREPRFAHGTPQAFRLHVKHREAPCQDCQAWWFSTHTRVCAICERSYTTTGQRRYCSAVCRELAYYLRYWQHKTVRVYRPQRNPGWERATLAQKRARQAGVDLGDLVARYRAS